jgi:hypothetical protein
MVGIGGFPGLKIESWGTPVRCFERRLLDRPSRFSKPENRRSGGPRRLRDGAFQMVVPFLFYNRLNSNPGNCVLRIA